MRYLKLLLYLLPCMVGCATNGDNGNISLNLDGSFNTPSLTGQTVFELKIEGDHLYAGTSNNLFRKRISEADWLSLGLPGQVQAFVILSEQKFLATLNRNNRDSLTIARTTDGGQNWTPFRNGYGGGINRRVPDVIVKHPSKSNVLFAGGPGSPDIAKSANQGQSWKLILGTWESLGFLTFITTNNNNMQIIWAGGSNAIFEPFLVKSLDGGENWQFLQVFENVETAVYDVVIHPSKHNRVLAGLGGGIRKSTEGGQSWRTVLEGAGIYSMAQSARDDRIVYATGASLTGTLTFWASGDFGDTWQQVTMADGPQDIYVNDLISVIEGGAEVLYLGTNQGVYSYRFEK